MRFNNMKIKLSELKQLIQEELSNNRYARVEVYQVMSYVNPSFMTQCGQYFTEEHAKKVVDFLNKIPEAEGRKYKYQVNIDSILYKNIDAAMRHGVKVKIIERD